MKDKCIELLKEYGDDILNGAIELADKNNGDIDYIERACKWQVKEDAYVDKMLREG